MERKTASVHKSNLSLSGIDLCFLPPNLVYSGIQAKFLFYTFSVIWMQGSTEGAVVPKSSFPADTGNSAPWISSQVTSYLQTFCAYSCLVSDKPLRWRLLSIGLFISAAVSAFCKTQGRFSVYLYIGVCSSGVDLTLPSISGSRSPSLT